ncbi:MAG: ANTAR domain-containing protein, partial [Clostridia bacterium]|nr:ANTAR domain-containing protein [Clostridia bacterium]
DTSCSILLTLRQQESIDQIRSILAPRGYLIVEACTSGMQALRVAGMNHIDIAIVGFTLSDMPGLTFANDLLSQYNCSVLMITPPEQINYVRQNAGPNEIICLPRPVTAQSLLTSIDLILQYKERFEHITRETRKLKSDLDRRAIAEKAKTLLMNKMNMGEAEAWRYIQKQSMDSGIPLQEVAEAIIKEYGKKERK